MSSEYGSISARGTASPVMRRTRTRTRSTTATTTLGAIALLVAHLATQIALATVGLLVAVLGPVTETIAVEALGVRAARAASVAAAAAATAVTTTSKLYTDARAAQINAIQTTNSILGITIVFHFNEGEARRRASHPHADNATIAAELILEVLLAGIQSQVANEDAVRGFATRRAAVAASGATS